MNKPIAKSAIPADLQRELDDLRARAVKIEACERNGRKGIRTTSFDWTQIDPLFVEKNVAEGKLAFRFFVHVPTTGDLGVIDEVYEPDPGKMFTGGDIFAHRFQHRILGKDHTFGIVFDEKRIREAMSAWQAGVGPAEFYTEYWPRKVDGVTWGCRARHSVVNAMHTGVVKTHIEVKVLERVVEHYLPDGKTIESVSRMTDLREAQ